MSKQEILEYLKEKSPTKFSAKEIIQYMGLKSQRVFSVLRTLRKFNEISYDLIEHDKGKPVRVYSHLRDLPKKKGENVFHIKEKYNSKELSKDDIGYFFVIEENLIRFKNEVKKIILGLEGCYNRISFKKYPRKKHIEQSWKEIKEVIENTNNRRP